MKHSVRSKPKKYKLELFCTFLTSNYINRFTRNNPQQCVKGRHLTSTSLIYQQKCLSTTKCLPWRFFLSQLARRNKRVGAIYTLAFGYATFSTDKHNFPQVQGSKMKIANFLYKLVHLKEITI